MIQKYDFEQLFREFNNKVYRLALSITRDKDDAQDVVQNTFLKTMENIAKFRGRSQISTWVYKIAYNEALMLLRRKNRQFSVEEKNLDLSRQIPSGLYVNWPEVPDRQLLKAELKNRLDAAIKSMPIKYRMPLLLHKVEGKPLKEISQIMGLKVNSVKTRIRRARGFVREEIRSYVDDVRRSNPDIPEDCNLFVKFIHDYVDKKLSGRNKKSFEEHIKDCEDCKDFLKSYSAAITITNFLTCEDLPKSLQNKLKSFITEKMAV